MQDYQISTWNLIMVAITSASSWNFVYSLWLIWRSNHRDRYIARVWFWFLLSILAYSLPLPTKFPMMLGVTLGGMTAFTPFLAWLAIDALVDPSIRPSKIHYFLCPLLVIAGIASFFLGGGYSLPHLVQEGMWVAVVSEFFSCAIALLYMVLTMVACLKGLEDDLVEPRRLLRKTISISTAIVCSLAIVFRSLFGMIGGPSNSSSASFILIDLSLLAIFVVSVVFQRAVSTQLDELFPPDKKDKEKHQNEFAQDTKRLLAHIQKEHSYRDPNLRFKTLSKECAISETRLREIIHKSLGFRNFNSFLNHYRIEEAAKILADPKEHHQKVFAIALDVGFANLAPFNKAFKEIHGITPSEFRAQASQNTLPLREGMKSEASS